MMNIIDYLIGNTDRHRGNWGFWVNNADNRLETLHPLMDFNQAFHSYDTLDGAKCLTTETPMSQKEAAIAGVQSIGLNQIHKLQDDFSEFIRKLNEQFGMRLGIMFEKRLELLQETT